MMDDQQSHGDLHAQYEYWETPDNTESTGHHWDQEPEGDQPGSGSGYEEAAGYDNPEEQATPDESYDQDQ